MFEVETETQIGQVTTRLLRPGEGTRAVAVAEEAGMPGLEARKDPLQAVLDHSGGVFDLGVPDLPNATGWCVGAYLHDELVGMLYACSPVTFLRSFAAEHRAGITRRLVEIEMLAVEQQHRGQGVGSALLGFVEEYFAQRPIEYVLVKIDATDGPVLRWYRHRGYLLARAGESCYIDTPAGPAGINAGPSTSPWRLAITTPGRTGRRQQRGHDGFSVTTG